MLLMPRLTYMLVFLMLLTSCYRRGEDTRRYYGANYNFVATDDSLRLLAAEQPLEVLNGLVPDTLTIDKEDILVVADIMIVSDDEQDSVWVQVAHDEETVGWVHESELLEHVSPDNPISRFIDFFSKFHLFLVLVLLVLFALVIAVRRRKRHKAKIVHFNDIPSVYPTLLCILVAASAVFYSTIQLFDPESWRAYYFHPTLNPFSVPLHLSLFLSTVWLMLIVAVAAFDDVRRNLHAGQALFYLLSLACICAVSYVIFSVSTLYYVGYLLLVAYIVFAVVRYWRHSRARYLCGQCGRKLHDKGKCPYCDVVNK